MSEMRHTPGPWKWFNYPDGRKLLISKNESVLHCPDAPIGITPEDQLLIERAPDLLKALRDLLNVIAADELIPESVSYMQQARAVIAEVESPVPLRLEGR